MGNIVIDTNPLVYIYAGTDSLGTAYAGLLDELAPKNMFIIPKIVYGELSLMFDDSTELTTFVNETGIIIGDMTPDAYLTAADRWRTYNNRRVIMCHRCGRPLGRLTCKECRSEIKIRQHVLSDFLIGAFALHAGGRIVTHDKGYFSTYFPELEIVTYTISRPS